MTSIPTLSPRLVGQAEHAHRALLERLLSPSGRTYREWVALSLLASGPRPIARSELVETMRNALKADDAEVGRTVEELQVAGLIERGPGAPGRVGLSASGRQLHERIATEVASTVSRLYGSVPADELATAGRVLRVITDRIGAELAA